MTGQSLREIIKWMKVRKVLPWELHTHRRQVHRRYRIPPEFQNKKNRLGLDRPASWSTCRITSRYYPAYAKERTTFWSIGWVWWKQVGVGTSRSEGAPFHSLLFVQKTRKIKYEGNASTMTILYNSQWVMYITMSDLRKFGFVRFGWAEIWSEACRIVVSFLPIISLLRCLFKRFVQIKYIYF